MSPPPGSGRGVRRHERPAERRSRPRAGPAGSVGATSRARGRRSVSWCCAIHQPAAPTSTPDARDDASRATASGAAGSGCGSPGVRPAGSRRTRGRRRARPSADPARPASSGRGPRRRRRTPRTARAASARPSYDARASWRRRTDRSLGCPCRRRGRASARGRPRAPGRRAGAARAPGRCRRPRSVWASAHAAYALGQLRQHGDRDDQRAADLVERGRHRAQQPLGVGQRVAGADADHDRGEPEAVVEPGQHRLRGDVAEQPDAREPSGARGSRAGGAPPGRRRPPPRTTRNSTRTTTIITPSQR